MRSFEDFAEYVETELDDRSALRVCRSPRWKHPGNAIEAADHFVVSLGYEALGALWYDLEMLDHAFGGVEPGDPAGHLASMLEREMVHGGPWLAKEEARACAEEFYSNFRNGPSTRLANRLGNGWCPITRSTIEAAYVVVDDAFVGLFLMEAED